MTQTINVTINQRSSRSRFVAFWLCLLLGLLGVHRFYVGKAGSGLLYFFTGGLCVVGALWDLLMIMSGAFRDADGLPLR